MVSGPLGTSPSHADIPVRERSGPSISAVLPAYNEEALIEGAVRRMAGVLRDLTSEYEIIVVNDGSSDRTGQVLASLAQSGS